MTTQTTAAFNHTVNLEKLRTLTNVASGKGLQVAQNLQASIRVEYIDNLSGAQTSASLVRDLVASEVDASGTCMIGIPDIGLGFGMKDNKRLVEEYPTVDDKDVVGNIAEAIGGSTFKGTIKSITVEIHGKEIIDPVYDATFLVFQTTPTFSAKVELSEALDVIELTV